MIKAKDWAGQNLKGAWLVTLKLDGVRALSDGEKVTSRNGKPLYGGLDRWADRFQDAEIFAGDFKATIQLVRTHNGRDVKFKEIYSLDPVDERLVVGEFTNLSSAEINKALKAAVINGYEGLVLRQGDVWLKVKPTVTHDVEVLDVYEGEGKHQGRLGGFITEKGSVGTGLTDEQRQEFWENKEICIGRTIEVQSMELTPDGKFRFPRFLHFRFDK